MKILLFPSVNGRHVKRRKNMMRYLVFCLFSVFVIYAATARDQIYPADSDPAATINQAISSAQENDKAVLVIFGADWCGDCRALHDLMKANPVKKTVSTNFEVVHVDVGNWDKNEGVRKIFGYPAENGIPSLVIMDNSASVRFVSRNGEFAGARTMGNDEFNRRLEDLLNQMKDTPS